MEVIITEEFERFYGKLSRNIQRKAEKQTELFKRNVFHPSLHTEKLEPRNKEVWSFRDSVRFLVIGPHDWIYKLKF